MACELRDAMRESRARSRMLDEDTAGGGVGGGGPLDGGALMKLASNLKGGGVGWESTGGEEEVGAPTWGS